MVKKKIDARVRTLIENGVKQRHRTMFVLVGDRGREQVRSLLLRRALERAEERERRVAVYR